MVPYYIWRANLSNEVQLIQMDTLQRELGHCQIPGFHRWPRLLAFLNCAVPQAVTLVPIKPNTNSSSNPNRTLALILNRAAQVFLGLPSAPCPMLMRMHRHAASVLPVRSDHGHLPRASDAEAEELADSARIRRLRRNTAVTFPKPWRLLPVEISGPEL